MVIDLGVRLVDHVLTAYVPLLNGEVSSHLVEETDSKLLQCILSFGLPRAFCRQVEVMLRFFQARQWGVPRTRLGPPAKEHHP